MNETQSPHPVGSSVGLGPFCDLLKAVRKMQADAKLYGLAGATNHPAVWCEVKGLTLGHWYDLAKAMDALIGPNDEMTSTPPKGDQA